MIGDFTGVAAAGELSGALATGQLFDAQLLSASGIVSYDHTGEFDTGTMLAADGLLSAGALLSYALFGADLSAGPGVVESDFQCGKTFNLSISASPGKLSGSFSYGAGFSLSIKAAPARLSGAFAGEILFAADLAASGATINAICAIDGPETLPSAWSVNLKTGGHSCYFGKLDGSETVQAKIVTANTDFGSGQQKYVPALYLNMRTDGDVKIDSLTDEKILYQAEPIDRDGLSGIHRRRDKRPRGIRGGTWQFSIENMDGADFTIKQLDAEIVESARRK